MLVCQRSDCYTPLILDVSIFTCISIYMCNCIRTCICICISVSNCNERNGVLWAHLLLWYLYLFLLGPSVFHKYFQLYLHLQLYWEEGVIWSCFALCVCICVSWYICICIVFVLTYICNCIERKGWYEAVSRCIFVFVSTGPSVFA